MTARLVGPETMSARRDEDGHRTYDVTWRVRTRFVPGVTHDGPAYIMNNWPLPLVGSPYNLALFWPELTDIDLWAFCTPELNIAPSRDVKEGDPCQDWLVTQHWSTKQSWRCQTNPVENPLLEPADIQGAFTHEQRMAAVDRFGKPLTHPNHQPITGPLAEVKYSYPSISITFNSATLPLSTFVLLINKVNDAPLWDVPARGVRFIDANWERKVYGSCFYYFRTTYTFEFDVNGFDPIIPAFGTMVLKNGGNPNNPKHFELYKTNDENAETMLNERGEAVSDIALQAQVKKEIAKEGNLLLLGIPSTLN